MKHTKSNGDEKSGHPSPDEAENLEVFFQLLLELDRRERGNHAEPRIPEAGQKERSITSKSKIYPRLSGEYRKPDHSKPDAFTECDSELRRNHVPISKNLSKGITIRLDPKTLKTLRILASEKGIGPTTLIRMWIKDQLKMHR